VPLRTATFFGPILGLATLAGAETSIFVGQVMGDRANGLDTTVLQRFLGESASSDIGAAGGRIAKDVIDQIEEDPKFTHFARPVDVYAELPDDLLLMVLAIEGADEDVWQTALFSDDFKTIVSAVSLQLVDPRTGQVAYSDFEVLNSDHHTTAAGELIPVGRTLPLVQRGLYSPEGNDFLVPDGSGGSRLVQRSQMHMNLVQHAVAILVKRMLSNFNGVPSDARVVRRVDRNRGLFLLNRGRTDGFFPGARLASRDGGHVLQITESRPTYALATVVHGDVESLSQSPWSLVRGYLPTTGHGSTLTTVGRIVGSPDLLGHGRLEELASDESTLRDRLNGLDGRPPLYQPLLASRASAALAESGHFRVMSPTGSLAPIKRAKSRINAALNLQQRDGDPLFYESLVLPDQVATLFVAAPVHQFTSYIQAATKRVVSNQKSSLWQVHGGIVLTGVDPSLVLAAANSGTAASGSLVEWIDKDQTPAIAPKSDHVRVIRECLLGSLRTAGEDHVFAPLIPSAVENLVANYDPIDITGRVTEADEVEVVVEFFDPAVATPDEVVEICAEIGKLPLEPQGGRITTILRRVGRAKVAEREGRRWYLDVIEWDSDVDPSALPAMGAVVPLYGRNARRTDPLHLGTLTTRATAPENHPLSDTDAQLMLFAATAAYPELPLRLPPYLVDRINAFHRAKFVSDVAYRDADATIGAAQSNTERSPGYTLHAAIHSLEAPVTRRGTGSIDMTLDVNKTLDLNCRVTVSLTDPDGLPACDAGSAATQKQKTVSADDFEGQPAGQIWLSQTLPPFMKFFRTKKMEQMP